MTNFVIGAIVGFLLCVWAIGATPSSAVASLWTKLGQVQEMSAAADQAYEAVHSYTTQRTSAPAVGPDTQHGPAPLEVDTYR
ncbi:hypothetical protein F2P47_11430 [Parvibaculum sedimenti]|uniref:Uncharacterized protein n=1 Tax=Parvibaculum sedimenti TaxID=2608632 RepID=A0A6N6VL97_9HYPH|nr:hypothetical protein [Parvibaculum sedimenti]KAB7739681.1 hypothetical protein F2P47_11430 [Parvibaculum sedimenti]